MIFQSTALDGVTVIDIEPHVDERGFFARAWCSREFSERGLQAALVQANVSYNRRRGTLRGLHYQQPPYAETKLVRCTRGAIFDVVVDLRPGSDSFGQWLGVELRADAHRLLYVPAGFAHGFQTLDDDVEVFYQVSEFYTPGAERGLRHDDPRLNIDWPLPVSAISAKDAAWPDFDPERLNEEARRAAGSRS